MIDFSPVHAGSMKVSDLAASGITLADMQATTEAQFDAILALITPLTDAQTVHIAHDPEAEGGVGWNVPHLLAHCLSSFEENASVSSILARGISYPFEPRLRFEVDWTTLTTTAACVARVQESRRMGLAYLQAWPDQPTLTTFRTMPERFTAHFGELNAIGTYLLGLSHNTLHMVQLQEIVRQAK